MISINNTGGKWQYTIDSGTTWTAFGTVSGSSAVLLNANDTNRIRFVPDPNFRGSISNGITFRAWDQSDGYQPGQHGVYVYTTGGSSPYSTQSETASLNIRSKNHAPTLNAISGLNILEDQNAATVNLSGIGPGVGDDGQSLTVTASSLSPSIVSNPQVTYISPQSIGSLLITPAQNVSGSANISVRARDNGGTADNGIDSITQTFRVTVLPVNDPPSLQKGSDPIVFEDASKVSLPGWGKQITSGPADEQTQTLSVTLTADKPSLFSIQPFIDLATGTLNFQPAANAIGTTNVQIRLSDDGTTDNGGVNQYFTSFTITIAPINDPPTIQKGVDPNVLEDAGSISLVGWAGQPSPGPDDEDTQNVIMSVAADDPAMFSIQPALDPLTGTLTFTPDSKFFWKYQGSHSPGG